MSHRPWPRPERAWVMAQRWHDLLFAHWPVAPDAMRAHVPDALELDTFDGRAWVGVVPFRMSGIRARFFPPIPGTSAFPELNVRTYVRHGGKAGVWFFTLEATNRLAVAFARRFFHLPYHRARMSCRRAGEAVHYASERAAARFRGVYRPTGAVYRARPGDLDHWLTERYCLYAQAAGGRLFRGEIDHAPWPLQPAAAELETLDLPPFGPLADPPHLHFARRLDVHIWRLTRVRLTRVGPKPAGLGEEGCPR